MKARPQFKPSRKQHFLTALAYMVLGAAAFIICLVIYWTSIQPSNIYAVKGAVISVSPPAVKAGDNIALRFSFCKNIGAHGDVTRTFVGENTEVASIPTVDNLPKSCFDNVVVTVPVPAQLAPGTYRVKYDGEYPINPLKTVHAIYFSEPFTVQ